MKTILMSLCAYNVWANKRIIEILQNHSEDILDKTIDSSFQSIRKTIYHIWDAQVIWLNRLQGISLNTWPSMEYDDAFAGYDIYFIQQSFDFQKFIETRGDGFFESTCFYKTLNGTNHQTKHWQIILHAMNHSTYHRGQLITMFRMLGITEMLSTDYNFYVGEMESAENNLRL